MDAPSLGPSLVCVMSGYLGAGAVSLMGDLASLWGALRLEVSGLVTILCAQVAERVGESDA